MSVEHFDIAVVGGGPAGASCAWRLKQHGLDVAILDLAEFPREKLCAGWVTPDVFENLDMSPDEYPHGIVRFDRIHGHYKWVCVPVRTTQYSVRRFEFDAFLVERAGVPIRKHRVRKIERTANGFDIDGQFSARIVVGAGGTRCPIYRTFFNTCMERPAYSQIVALEKEFRYDWTDPRCHLFFFDDGLKGYSWYVPKAGGFLNCGVGGMAEDIQTRSQHIKEHWQVLLQRLKKIGVPEDALADPHGYSYYLRERNDVTELPGLYLIGDALGLATRDLGEGIGPAVQSGVQTADRIRAGERLYLNDIYSYSPIKPTLARMLDRRWKRQFAPSGENSEAELASS